MTDNQLIEFICACHLSRHVPSEDFPNRGGLLLVSGSGHMKTTFIDILKRYGDFRGVSDLTVRGLDMIRDSMVEGSISTLGFLELRKVYERRDDIARSMEASLECLVEEGYGLPNWKDQTVVVTKARCMVIGALTRTWFNEKITSWKNSFFRRFLIVHYGLSRVEDLTDAVQRWERIAIGGRELPEMPTTPIPMSMSNSEREEIRRLMIRYRGDAATTPYSLLIKAASVMRWHANRVGVKDRTMEKLAEIAETFAAEPLSTLVFDSLAKPHAERKGMKR